MLRKAIKVIESFSLFCPKCNSFIACAENGGSSIWPTNMQLPTTVTCFDCKTVLSIPKQYRAAA